MFFFFSIHYVCECYVPKHVDFDIFSSSFLVVYFISLCLFPVFLFPLETKETEEKTERVVEEVKDETETKEAEEKEEGTYD